jgi:hypothetical protein
MPMQTAILYPVFLQVFLTFAVLVLMGAARRQSMIQNRNRLEDKDVALGTLTWNEDAHKRSKNFINQFELPVLFYGAVAFALILKQADGVMLALAWVFALTRLGHALIHVGANVVRWRGMLYLVGAAALLAMWVVLAVRVLAGASA